MLQPFIDYICLHSFLYISDSLTISVYIDSCATVRACGSWMCVGVTVCLPVCCWSCHCPTSGSWSWACSLMPARMDWQNSCTRCVGAFPSLGSLLTDCYRLGRAQWLERQIGESSVARVPDLWSKSWRSEWFFCVIILVIVTRLLNILWVTWIFMMKYFCLRIFRSHVRRIGKH